MKKLLLLTLIPLLLTLFACGLKVDLLTPQRGRPTETSDNDSIPPTTLSDEPSSQTEVLSTSAITPSTTKPERTVNGNQFLYLQRTNHTDIAAPKIISAFETKGVAALESLMCQNIKDNVPDLPGKIGKMMNAIEGEITKSSWKTPGSYQERNANGSSIIQVNLDIYLTTTTGNYTLLLMWETANNFAPEEVGIRAISLLPSDSISVLAEIKATNGIGEWHN